MTEAFHDAKTPSNESQHFRFGKWEVKISAGCDSGEKLERAEHFSGRVKACISPGRMAQ